MKRRSFLKRSSVVAPAIVGGIPYSAINNFAFNTVLNGDSDRVLVLIQLNGGNDGLATVVPVDQQDNLVAARPNIFLPENKLLGITDTLAFHPVMDGMKSVYDEGLMKIVQGVGYPNQNGSHFRSNDIWHTGSSADQYLTTGWMGRYLESQFSGYPFGYPNDDCPDPIAISIGRTVSETCQGSISNFSIAAEDPATLAQLSTPLENNLLEGCGANEYDFLSTTINLSNDNREIVINAFESGNNLSSKYNDEDDLSNQLKTVARLISGGLRTKVYVVSLGGFDTHAGQVQAEDSCIGIHANLLKSVSDAIYAFQDDLQLLNIDDRVMGMTYSEFGRRIVSNGSLGTDHGSAAPLMLFGKCVQGGITGDNAIISADVQQNEGVIMQYDFKSIYASVLMDWFDVTEEDAVSLVPHDFQYIPIINLCGLPSNTNDESNDHFSLKVYPNPFNQSFNLDFETQNDWLKITVFNTLGQELKVITNQQFYYGNHKISVDLSGYPNSAYFIRLQSRSAQKTVRVSKQ